MTAGNAALVSPDKRHSVEELVDVEFQGLGSLQVDAVEVDVVGEIAEGGDHFFVRQVFSELHIPQNIGEWHSATDIKLHGATAAQCWRLDSLGSSPGG